MSTLAAAAASCMQPSCMSHHCTIMLLYNLAVDFSSCHLRSYFIRVKLLEDDLVDARHDHWRQWSRAIHRFFASKLHATSG